MKEIVKLLIVTLLMIPALLTFTEGEDGGVTVWNFVGLAYSAVWVYIINKAEEAKKNRK